ncbi:Ldh family oxidoreductase [Arthrobacter subterraneus]|uniref:Ldh family oxidoreductase n=1 Tax=Arthrobacter subterraneus TaxID=335973 RepID=UPI003829AAC1
MSEQKLVGYDIEPPAEAGPAQRVDVDSLRDVVSQIMEAAGYPSDRAALVADSLVHADMRGVASHGVTRARIYSKRAKAGLVDPRAVPTVSGGTRAGRRLDASNAPGQVAAEAAVQEAIKGARDLGVCVVGVVNSNHCGTLAYFLEKITAAGLVGLAATNGPAVMAYFGSRARAVGTNPLGYGIPRSDGPPIILDMATSNAARGKIIAMARSGEGEVPDGWAIDTEGRPTTDPVAALAGAVLPFGGPKGSGLAMGIEFLCGTLLSGITGPAVGDMYEHWDRTQQVGHIFFALDPECWSSAEIFDSNVRRFVQEIHNLPPAAGADRVYLPGEIEDAAAEDAAKNGVLLSGAVIADLRALATEAGVSRKLETVGETMVT